MINDNKILVDLANKFNFILLKHLQKDDSSHNKIFSGFGIFAILTLLQLASIGTTKDEIADAIGFRNSPDNAINDTFESLIKEINRQKETSILYIYNSIWTRSIKPIQELFYKIATEKYATEVHKFNALMGVKEIEQWINDRSNKLFASIDLQSVLGKFPSLVILNLTYFREDWYYPFDHHLTKPRDFRLLTGETIQVPMMTKTTSYKYRELDYFELIDLPYSSSSIMRIILPREQNTLEEAFEAYKELKSIKMISYDLITLSLPKFSVSYTIDCGQMLQQLGIKQLFNPNNNEFSIIQDSNDNIDSIIQYSFIKSDEKGTEAGSLTIAYTLGGVNLQEPVKVEIKRPFIFIIIDTITHLIVYTGIILNPLQS